MTRRYGRAIGGARCVGYAPNGHWKSMTMLSSIRVSGETECMVVDGALNKELFDAYIERFLCPTIKAGDIVIMDNLATHKSERAKKAIESRGASVWFLPPYSPDLNPIEHMWSKVKQLLRGLEKRTWDELEKGIAWALNKVSPKDAIGWFNNCGYT